MFSKKKKKRNSNPKQQIILLKDEEFFIKINRINEHTHEMEAIKDDVILNMIVDTPKLNKTYPYASFNDAEKLFQKLRQTYAIGKQIDINVDLEIMSWVDEKHKKDTTLVELEECVITYRYKNILVNIFEEVVNTNNSGLDNDMIINFLDSVKEAYIQSTHENEANLPVTPTITDLENNDTYYQAETQDLTTDNSREAVNDTDNPREAVNDTDNPREAVNDTDNSREAVNDTDNPRKAVNDTDNPREAVNDTDNPREAVNHGAAKKIVGQTSSRKIYQELVNEVEQKIVDNSTLSSGVKVIAPKFNLSKVQPAKPYEPQYVQYMLDQRKAAYNEQLKLIADKLNSHAEYDLVTRQQKDQKTTAELEDKLKHDIYFLDKNKIKQNVHKVVITEKQTETDAEYQLVETAYQNDITSIEAEYKAKLANAKRDFESKKQHIDFELSQKYAIIEQDKTNEELQLKEKINNDKIISNLKEFTIQLEQTNTSKINQIKEINQKALQEAYDKLLNTLPDYEATLQTQYLNAVQTHAVEERAQDVGMENTRVKELNTKLDKQNATLIQERQNTLTEISTIQNTLNMLQEKLSEIPEINQAQNETLNTKIAQLHEELQIKKRHQSRLNKQIIASGAILAMLGVGSGVAYGATINQKTNQLQSQNTKLLKQLKQHNHNQEQSKNQNQSENQEQSKNQNQSENQEQSKNQNQSENQEQSKNQNQSENQEQQKNTREYSDITLPTKAKELVKKGKWTQLIKYYPTYSNTIEDKAFKSGNVKSVNAINSQVATVYGKLDEAILSNNPSKIISAYINSHLNHVNGLIDEKRVSAVGRAYLIRNRYSEAENDYINAVNVWQLNKANGWSLYHDLQFFATYHKLP